jgi:hypothetical protein
MGWEDLLNQCRRVEVRVAEISAAFRCIDGNAESFTQAFTIARNASLQSVEIQDWFEGLVPTLDAVSGEFCSQFDAEPDALFDARCERQLSLAVRRAKKRYAEASVRVSRVFDAVRGAADGLRCALATADDVPLLSNLKKEVTDLGEQQRKLCDDLARICQQAADKKRSFSARRRGALPTPEQLSYDQWQFAGYPVTGSPAIVASSDSAVRMELLIVDLQQKIGRAIQSRVDLGRVCLQLEEYARELTTQLQQVRCRQLEVGDVLMQSVRRRRLGVIEQLIRRPFVLASKIASATSGQLPYLDLHDNELVSLWGKNSDRKETVKLRAARAAEKFMIDRYSELFRDVIDVSIEQLTASDGNWQSFDIDVPGYSPVDVKHARECARGATWSGLYVKCWKLAQSGDRVTVAGVITRMSDIDSSHSPHVAQWIGDCSSDWQRRLGGVLRSAAPSIRYQQAVYNQGVHIPPWAFEYPAAAYRVRDESLMDIKSKLESWSIRRLPAPLCALVPKSMPSDHLGGISAEVLALRNTMERCGIITRSVVYAHVLERFCAALRSGELFPAQDVRDIIFYDGLETAPCALADPQCRVARLIDMLEIASQRCIFECRRYDGFSLTGARILRGYLRSGGSVAGARQHSIIAYCGQCGKDPIHIGQDYLCEHCGFLKCHCCGYRPVSCKHCASKEGGITD